MSNLATYPSLNGMPVVISGGASGIGETLVREFAGQGSKVGFVDIARDQGEALAKELNDKGGYGDRDGVGIGREGGIMGRGHGESCDEGGCRGMPDLRGHQGTGPELRLLEGRTFGGLSKEVVQRHVRANRGRIRHCYESALQTQADLSGRVTVSFVIAPQGNVQSVRTQANTTNDAPLAQCIESVVGRINFPSADGVTACTYPFLLQMAGTTEDD